MSERTYPKLFKKKKNGSIYTWEIEVVTDDMGNAWIRTTYGLDTGKKIVSDDKISEGANIGKVNETNPFERACLLADTKFENQKIKGYNQIISDSVDPSPMLAVTYEHAKKMGKINFDTEEYLLQRKFDGTRMLVHMNGKDEIVATSRNKKKDYELSDDMIGEIKKIYSLLPEELRYVFHLDGEGYHHGWSLQKINSIMSKDEQKKSGDIKYYIFDCFDPNQPPWSFSDRFGFLLDIVKGYKFKTIEFVETFSVSSEKEVYEERDRFISEGYEGGILRKANGIYHGLDNTAARTYDVMKLKKWFDLDLLVIDIHRGPKDKGIVLDTKLENGKILGATGTGTKKYRDDILLNKHKYIGKKVRIKYTILSDDGIPKNATTILNDDGYIWS